MNKFYAILILLILPFFLSAKISKTVNCIAGELSNLLTYNEITTVTDLTITGTIDARDFKTMRDSMPVLAEIDMSVSTIMGYIGYLGTITSQFKTNYYENTIPEKAFSPEYGKASLTKIIMPISTTKIGNTAFASARNLAFINFPNSIQEIGSGAFYSCISLFSISIPPSITNIGSACFSRSNVSVTVNPSNAYYSSSNGILFNKDKTEIFSCPMTITGHYTIPSTVTKIAACAFGSCHDLTSIIIPMSVTDIGGDAFSFCSGLTDVIIPNSVTDIGSYCFQSCSELRTIVLPTNLTKINHEILRECRKLVEVTIPSNVEFIGRRAFSYCIALTTITIPSKVSFIDYEAFNNCVSINSIYVNMISPTDISTNPDVFNGIDTSNCELHVPYQTKYLYEEADQWKNFNNIIERPGFHFPIDKLYLLADENSNDSLIIEANVTWEISNDAPWLSVFPITGNNNRTIHFTASANSDISNRVANLTISSESASSQTIQLIQYGLPTTITGSAGSLTNILTFGEKNNTSYLKINGTIDARDFKTMRDSMPLLSVIDLSNATINGYTGELGPVGDTIISYIQNSIPKYAFYSSDSLVGKKGLSFITLPTTADTIDDYAFYNCIDLCRIIFQTVNHIGKNAFAYCSSIKTLNLPTTVNTIDDYAFSNCINLLSVENYAQLSSIGEYAFSETAIKSIQLPSSLMSIEHYAFSNCKNLSNIVIPLATDEIGRGVFYKCCKLENVIINSSITEIPTYFFYGCYLLSNLDIPNTVQSIGFYSFAYCAKLKNILIPSSVSTIFSGAFSRCNSFTNIVIPNSVQSIGSSAFFNCEELTSITLPNTITELDKFVLYECTKLDTILIPNSVSILKEHSLRYCNFRHIKLPPSLRVIERFALANNTNLKYVEIPESVYSIGEYVFSSCDSIESIKCERQYPIDLSLSPNVFKNVDKTNCILYVPVGSCNRYKAANQWQDFNNIFEFSDVTVSTEIVNVGMIGVSDTIIVTSDKDWSAVVDQDWLSIEIIQGMQDTDTILIHSQTNYNEQRRATITITGQLINDKTITINQNEGGIVLNKYVSFFSSIGGNDTIYLETSINWNVTLDGDWLSINKNAGLVGKDTLILTTSINSGDVKTATITFSGNGVDNKTINIIQQEGGIILSRTHLEFQSSGGTDTINLFSNVNWTAVSNKGWLTTNPIFGFPGSQVVTLNALLFSDSDRTATITFSAQGFPDKNISISQTGYISIFPWTEDFENNGNIPNEWTQENIDSSGVKWAFITGNGDEDPEYANSGLFNACLIDEDEGDDKTRLITPRLNLNCIDNPILKFWHTQPYWDPDQDFLTIYSKNSIDSSWIELKAYTNSIESWTEDSILLQNPSSDYYICFEGNAKYGFGVCIDDVNVNGISKVPENLNIENKTLGNGEFDCFNATSEITVAGADSVILGNGSSTTLIAGQSIRFLSGFHAEAGSFVDAHITTDGSFCDDLPAPFIKNLEIAEKSSQFDDQELHDEIFNIDPTIKVYPNPNNGSFKLDLINFDFQTNVAIFNVLGECVYRKPSKSQGTLHLTIPNKKKGIYFIRASDCDSQLTKKMIVN